MSRRMALIPLLALAACADPAATETPRGRGGGPGWGKADGPWSEDFDTRPIGEEELSAIDDDLGGDPGKPGVARDGIVTIQVAVHVLRTGTLTAEGNVGRARILRQIDVLNAAFSGAEGGADTPFRFQLASIERRTNETWFHAVDDTFEERDMKAALRMGGADMLNLYIAEPGDELLGYATFPFDYEGDPEIDGVVVLHASIPGGEEPFADGDTAVHEVGHWLGLSHTFEGGCDGGDHVADTAPERSAASGCPAGRDTCRGDDLEDPISNYMDYTDDDCLYEFTPGQARRMASMWSRYRQP